MKLCVHVDLQTEQLPPCTNFSQLHTSQRLGVAQHCYCKVPAVLQLPGNRTRPEPCQSHSPLHSSTEGLLLHPRSHCNKPHGSPACIHAAAHPCCCAPSISAGSCQGLCRWVSRSPTCMTLSKQLLQGILAGNARGAAAQGGSTV
jgi:hypothetical protein